MKLAHGIARYVLIGQGVIPALINVVVNVIVGALTFWGRDSVATWSVQQGAAADTIGTCFFLPFITTLIVTPIIRRHLAQGVVGHIPADDISSFLHWFKGSTLRCAFKFGFAVLMLLAIPVYFAYCLFAGESIETAHFIAIKAGFAGVLGLVVTPIIALVVLSDQSTSSQPRRT